MCGNEENFISHGIALFVVANSVPGQTSTVDGAMKYQIIHGLGASINAQL